MDSVLKIHHKDVELFASEYFIVAGSEPVVVELRADQGTPLNLELCFDWKDESKKETSDYVPESEVTDKGYRIYLGNFEGGNAAYWPIGTTDREDEEILMMMHVDLVGSNDKGLNVRKILLSFYKRKGSEKTLEKAPTEALEPKGQEKINP